MHKGITMSLWMYWAFRRCRRVLPAILALVAICITYKYLMATSQVTLPKETEVTTVISMIPPVHATQSPLSRWLIVNTIRVDLCNKLASHFQLWNILFVTTASIPHNSHSACHSLSNTTATDLLSAAYIYSISVGADVIFVYEDIGDIDIFNPPLHLLASTSQLTWQFQHVSSAFVDVRSHFGCETVDDSAQSRYKLCQFTPSIYSPVYTHDKCDSNAPVVTLLSGTYTDAELSRSVFTRSAFWALLSFGSTVDRYKILWSYIVQWLLWQTGSGLTVFSSAEIDELVPNVPDVDVKLIIEFLSHEKCTTVEFVSCVQRIAKTLASAKMISEDFVVAVNSWMQNLTSVGYIFPALSAPLAETCTESVLFSPVHFSERHNKKFVPVTNVNYSHQLYEKLCSTTASLNTSSFTVDIQFEQPWFQFKNFLLIVTFNDPHYEVIPYIEVLYRPFFPHILYCGPELIDLSKYSDFKDYNLSFVAYTARSSVNISGALSYQCAIQAARMKYQVDGYLFASDDILLLPVPLSNLKPDFVWFIPKDEVRTGDLKTLRECRLGMCDFYPRWDWWQQYKDAVISALNAMKYSESVTVQQCLSQLLQINGENDLPRVNGGYSDVYHIPARLLEQFSELAEVFLKHDVFLEIAVPTLLYCIESPEHFQPLPGKQVWVEPRDQPWLYFTRSHLFQKMYLHPVKWSYLVNKSAIHTNFFCHSVLPYLHDPFSRLR